MADGGHSFGKKTFHKPTYCHHCSDLLWGLIGQGYICEVCNFIVHERCVSNVVTPCTGIAPCIIKNPSAHCWSEPAHHKRRFCTVCRKRLDETPAVHCMICEYFAHVECQDFAVPDCKENATYVPSKDLATVKHTHHWREGNLPQTSKCAFCKKTCWSSECLTGYRCEWCGMTTHGGCRTFIGADCTFGVLQPIYLPPDAVSIPRTEVPMEMIIGVQIKAKSTPLQRDYSCPELRSIGMCDATDSELSIRHLAAIGAQQPEHPACLLFLSPTYHRPYLPYRRFRQDSSCESFVLPTAGSETDTEESPHSYSNSAVEQDVEADADVDDDDDDDDDELQGEDGDVFDDESHGDDDDQPHRTYHPDISYNNNSLNSANNNNNHHHHYHNHYRQRPVDRLRNQQQLAAERTANSADGLVRVTVFRKQRAKKYHSAVNRIRNESVARSHSFQEQGVKPLLRNSRFFVNRHAQHQHPMAMMDTIASDLHLDTISQNIEITVQDEHGVPIESGGCGADSGVEHEEEVITSGDEDANCRASTEQLLKGSSAGGFGGGSHSALLRFFRRVRLLTLGWRRPSKLRRARSISEDFSSGDKGRSRDDECSSARAECSTASAHHSESLRPEGSGGAGGGGSGGSCSSATSSKDAKREKEREERDEETIKVFDGNISLRRRNFRPITVPRTCSVEQLLGAALRSLHISRDPSKFYLTDLYAIGPEEVRCVDPHPVLDLNRIEGKRPAVFLRFRDRENDSGTVRVYPGKLQLQMTDPFVNVAVDNQTTVKDLVRKALDQFGLAENSVEEYRCSEVMLDSQVNERILSWNERPWQIMKELGKDSIRQMEVMRFYLQHKLDPHGTEIALFVGNLPTSLSELQYEKIITKFTTDENKFKSIGPVYYEYGAVIIYFEDPSKAVKAFYSMCESVVEDKKLQVLLLPNIEPSMVPAGVQPLLVFVNVKSGGCQGLELISSFRKLLNPYQVFDLDNGGPLPGLYVFRNIKNYKILVCGGDGTIGWVLQCLDNVGQDSQCSNPACAIVPLGTGNDLARVLRWGPGFTGGEDPLNLLRDVIDAEEIRLDRWTVIFYPEDKPEDAATKVPLNTAGKKKKQLQQAQAASAAAGASSAAQDASATAANLQTAAKSGHSQSQVTGATQSEDTTNMLVMNNYFGIGIDADLCLDFHNAREENPNKFNSRLHNKGVYVKMGLRKMVGRKTIKELHRIIRLEVDHKVIELPPLEGIIILNIMSWGSGANPWGPDKDDHFSTPTHHDGMLEVVGVTGVVHLGQIQSGMRQAVRIAQGGNIRIHAFSEIPVQVDGEPWIQPPGDVVVFNSALKATMLKKLKGKMKRRNTEPTMMAVAGSSGAAVSLGGAGTGTALSLAIAPSPNETDENETDF